MRNVLGTLAVFMCLVGISPALAGLAWSEVTRVSRQTRVPPTIVCHISRPGEKPHQIHWPPEFYGRKAPPRR